MLVYKRERVTQANNCGLFYVSGKGEKTQEYHRGPQGSKYLETSFTLQTKPERQREMQKLKTGSRENWLVLWPNKLVIWAQKATTGSVPIFSRRCLRLRDGAMCPESKTHNLLPPGVDISPTRCRESVPETTDVSGRNHCFAKVLPASRPQLGAKQKVGK